MASLKFNEGEYHVALEMFQGVLKSDPGCPANVRLGIALCLHNLKEPEAAIKALERVLELEPNNPEAMAAMAVLSMNNGDIEGGMKAMAKASTINPRQAAVINHVANHLFHKGQYDTVITLAQKALKSTESPSLLAEANFQLARAYQAKEEYDLAHTHYAEAVNLDRQLVLAQYGLGQMYIHKRLNDKAIDCFEFVLSKDKDCFEAVRILASLYAKVGRMDDAHSLLKRVTAHNPRDPDPWMELGEIATEKKEDNTAKVH